MGKDEQLMAKQIVRNPVNRNLTYKEVNELSTDEITHKLGQIGIPFKQETFLINIEKFYSAEELSENWFDHVQNIRSYYTIFGKVLANAKPTFISPLLLGCALRTIEEGVFCREMINSSYEDQIHPIYYITW
jgi:hypothetical protein